MLTVAMEEKQKTLRPEIQLLNRLLAAETSAERKQARCMLHLFAWFENKSLTGLTGVSGTAVAGGAYSELPKPGHAAWFSGRRKLVIFAYHIALLRLSRKYNKKSAVCLTLDVGKAGTGACYTAGAQHAVCTCS